MTCWLESTIELDIHAKSFDSVKEYFFTFDVGTGVGIDVGLLVGFLVGLIQIIWLIHRVCEDDEAL